MLCITRKIGEVFYIYDENFQVAAKIKIKGARGNQISVGIDAVDSLVISRKELCSQEQIKKLENMVK